MNERFKNLKGISDIVDAMIQGLKRQWVTVNMDSYGYSQNGVCFGCAATNTICQLMGKAFSAEDVGFLDKRTEVFNYGISKEDLGTFENAINELRMGDLDCFIKELLFIKHLFGFEIPESDDIKPHFKLPYMDNEDYEEKLVEYERYRDWLRERGL